MRIHALAFTDMHTHTNRRVRMIKRQKINTVEEPPTWISFGCVIFHKQNCFYLIAFYHLRTVSWRALRAFFLFISRPHYLIWRHKLQFAIERQIQSYVFRRNHHIEFDVCNHISILSWNFFLLQYLIKIQFVLNLCAYSGSKTVFIGESWLLAKFNRIACLDRKKEHQLLCTASKCVCSYMRCTKCVLFVYVYVVRVSAVWLFFSISLSIHLLCATFEVDCVNVPVKFSHSIWRDVGVWY